MKSAGGETVPENRDNEDRRNEFVEAAEKLFQENGIVDTTINSIVKEMDVAKGLFYYYFKSKDDVIDAISEKYNQIFNEMMNASMEQEDYDSRLNQFVENSVNSFRSLYNKLHTGQDVDLTQLSNRSVEEARNKTISRLQELLDEGVRAQKLIIANTKYCASILISGIITLIEQNDAGDDEIKEVILNLISKYGKDE